MKLSLKNIREAAEADLETFIRLVHPQTVLGMVHKEVLTWWSGQQHEHQLLLLPRDHQKSRLIAYRVVWWLTKFPHLRVLYISSTSNLAEKQLKFMKDIFTSHTYLRYWPEMVVKEEAKRERWTASEISLDHPIRKVEGIRDCSIFTGGLTTSLTGLHCDIAVLDDVVVQENAYTREGRNKVKTQYSLLSSIESTDAQEWVVGTRYDPRDLYNDMMDMEEEVYDNDGNIIDYRKVYDRFERKVESIGDGTGEFLWPRQLRADGKQFGFNAQILARKRAKYLDRTQFRAQYYNDPTDPDGAGVKSEHFQYYDKKFLEQTGGHWYFKDKRLNIGCAIDFAFSLKKRADYTAIAVIGMDYNGYVYILDIDRFKTELVSEYFAAIKRMHFKWGFRKLRAETTAAQGAIVKSLKYDHITPEGLAITVEEHSPGRSDGSKEERLHATLNPRYENQTILHYRGGNCQLLEDELTVARPSHDDVKDAVMCAIDATTPPTQGRHRSQRLTAQIVYHERFGGVAR